MYNPHLLYNYTYVFMCHCCMYKYMSLYTYTCMHMSMYVCKPIFAGDNTVFLNRFWIVMDLK